MKCLIVILWNKINPKKTLHTSKCNTTCSRYLPGFNRIYFALKIQSQTITYIYSICTMLALIKRVIDIETGLI